MVGSATGYHIGAQMFFVCATSGSVDSSGGGGVRESPHLSFVYAGYCLQNVSIVASRAIPGKKCTPGLDPFVWHASRCGSDWGCGGLKL